MAAKILKAVFFMALGAYITNGIMNGFKAEYKKPRSGYILYR